ncbi:MAG: thioesterase [Flavobacteriaceae bacterium]|nr:thioesterase [Flavobacteriaceae bacterium]|tara:strand:+ start:1156 stop:1611 length:456 start_codon:yes stop_codon:yes gene_type:complete
MRITPSSIKFYTLFKLPAAYFTGVRVRSIDEKQCTVRVRLNFMNKNPFRSMFWAVQGMAAELSTGALIKHALHGLNTKASTLVIENKATFSKKAVGQIRFGCNQGEEVLRAIHTAKESNAPQQLWLHANGLDETDEEVSSFSFLWTIKVKN